jgi:hypothetical protein
MSNLEDLKAVLGEQHAILVEAGQKFTDPNKKAQKDLCDHWLGLMMNDIAAV